MQGHTCCFAAYCNSTLQSQITGIEVIKECKKMFKLTIKILQMLLRNPMFICSVL